MWVNDSGDYITNTQFIDGDMPPDFDAWEIPSCWKLDPLVNDGYPYIDLMLDLPRIELNPVKQYDYICIFCPRTVGGETVYPEQNELLNGNGDAILIAATVEVSSSKNAAYDFRGVHPIDSEGRWQYIKVGAIVRIMGQLYTIRTVQQSWAGNSGKITFSGDHIFYQLGDKWVYPYYLGYGGRIHLVGLSGQNAIDTINALTSAEERDGYFAYDFSGTSDLTFLESIDDIWMMPVDSGCTPIEALMGSGGLMEFKECELYRNNFYYSINKRMENADDDAFDIRIGKNLVGITVTIDTSSMVSYFRGYDPYGGWWAYAWDFSEFFGDLFPHYVVRSQNFDFPAAASDDDWSYDTWYSSVFKPQVRAFFQKNGKPIIRYEINLDDVRHNPDFEIVRGEHFRVGDKGKLYDARIGANPLTIEITGTVYDGITGRCTRVILGDQQSFVSTSMPAVDWGTLPEPVGGGAQEMDAAGNLVQDCNGDDIFISTFSEVI